jgi:hypothetical protein
LAIFLAIGASYLILGSQSAYATDYRSGDVVQITEGEILDDVFAYGGSINLSAGVLGDFLAAGQTVTISKEAEIDNSVMAAGQNVDLDGRVGNSARLAGQYLTIRGHIERNLMGFSQKTIVASDAWIEKDATLMAGEIIINGHIGGELNGSCGTATITGQVDGDVELETDKIVVQSNAIIGGKLKYRSDNDATIEEGARILGGAERLPPREAAGYSLADFVWDAWWFFASFAVGVLLLIMFRPFMSDMVHDFSVHSGKTVGLGFLFLVCLPVAAVVLMLTLVGIPLGVLILLGWLILAYLAKIFVGLALGDMLLGRARASRPWGMILALFIGMAIIALVVRIPYLGWLAWFIILATGFGGFFLTAYKFRTRRETR